MSLDFTKPVQTRNGRKVRILDTNFKSSYPVVGVVQQENGDEALLTWTLNGVLDCGSNGSPYDLVQIPEWISAYFPVYGNSTDIFSNFTKDEYTTLDDALAGFNGNVTHIMKLSICPGHEPKVEFTPVAEKE